MVARIENPTAAKRYVNLRDFAAYLGVGLNNAEKAAAKIGAKKKVGSRAVYDLQALDEYFANAEEIKIED